MEDASNLSSEASSSGDSKVANIVDTLLPKLNALHITKPSPPNNSGNNFGSNSASSSSSNNEDNGNNDEDEVAALLLGQNAAEGLTESGEEHEDENDDEEGEPEVPVPAQEDDDPCPQLFHPCTGDEIPKTASSIKLLDSLIFEIKQSMIRSIPGSRFSIKNASSNFEFIEKVFLNRTISLEEMVLIRLESGSLVGVDAYETLSRLFVFFGGVDHTTIPVNPRNGSDYKFMNKIEDVPHLPSMVYSSSIDALSDTTCKGTNDSGASDITLRYQAEEPPVDKKQIYLGSVKWLKQEKSPKSNYDIPALDKIAHTIEINGEILPRNKVNLLLFVKNKEEFEKKCKIDSQKPYCNACLPDNGLTYGWKEDVKPFLEHIRNGIFRKSDCEGKEEKYIFYKEYTNYISPDMTYE
jgi:hypothetical protein